MFLHAQVERTSSCLIGAAFKDTVSLDDQANIQCLPINHFRNCMKSNNMQ